MEVGLVTANKVKLKVLERESTRLQSSNFSIGLRIYEVGELLPIPDANAIADFRTILVFADDEPQLNFGHRCRYLLFEFEVGTFRSERDSRYPPATVDQTNQSEFQVFHESFRFAPLIRFPVPPPRIVRPLSRGRRYALMFSGRSNYRHVNNLEFLYRTLIDVYRYSPDDIIVLNYDGGITWDAEVGLPKQSNFWPGDQTSYRMNINGPAKHANLEVAFDLLRRRLRAVDSLLILIGGHGSNGIQPSFSCYYGSRPFEGIDDATFARWLRRLPNISCLNAVMLQCRGGWFGRTVIAAGRARSVSFAASCQRLDSSGGDGVFERFGFHWISAMRGADPYGSPVTCADINSDGNVTAAEAYQYARLECIRELTQGDAIFLPPDGGDHCSLGQSLFPFARLRSADDGKLVDSLPTDNRILNELLLTHRQEIDRLRSEFVIAEMANERRFVEQLRSALGLN